MDIEINCLPLFASHIFYTTLDIDVKPFKKLSKYYVKAAKHQNDQTSQDVVQVLDKIPKARQELLEIFKSINLEFFKYRVGESGNDWKITTSWITRTKWKQDSQFHNHRNSFYSGVFYYGEYDDEVAPLEIASPLQYHGSYKMENDYEVFGSCPRETAEQWSIPPKHQQLVFFPSHLMHRVGFHNSKKIRESLAFNIVPLPPYGRSDSSIIDFEFDESYCLKSLKDKNVKRNDPSAKGKKQSK